jgi:hypothetical protein
MKKTLFGVVLMIVGFSASAQISKNQWLVGGIAGFESAKFAGVKASIINFSPNAGYFFIDKLAGGLRMEFARAKAEGEDAVSALLVAPFARYYFLPAKDSKLNIFADASYGFGSEAKSSINQFAIQAGPAVFLGPNTALEFTLFYKSKGGEDFDEERLNSFGLNIGFQIHLGNSR